MSISSTVSTSRHRAEQPVMATAARKGLRADVQGLRALAVLLVVLYHARVPGISAGYVGVDVFFVISGFLITTHLASEATRTGRIRFGRFYARRIRRLLPAALLVVVATLAVARYALPPLRVSEVVTHSVWTTFYGINYRLAAEGVDYQKAGADPSPLQHYWSLAVEEQFYLVWPLLIVAALLLGRRWGTRALPAVLASVVVLSLVASVVLTASDPALSYFALWTRAWELGAGALVAVGAGRLATLHRRAALVMAWGGLAAIVGSAALYTDETAFPGAAALLPVGGAALVIAAGCGGQVPSITRLVGGRAVQTVGSLSYGWYLWHWPVLLLYPAVLHIGADPLRNVAVSVAALGLAYLTHRLVERPTQASRLPERTWLVLGAAMSAVTVGLAGLVLVSLPPLVGSGPAVQTVSTDEAATPAYLDQVQDVIATSASTRAAPSNLTPDVWRAATDYPSSTLSDGRCLADFPDVEQGPCVYGDPGAERTVVLFGDSHMEQWQPAFDRAGEEGGWKVVDWTKSACPLPDRPVQSSSLEREYTECERWRALTLERIEALDPDLVVVSQSDTNATGASTDQQYAAETVATVDRLRDTGLDVTYLLDTVYPSTDVPTCVSDHLDDVTACGRALEADGTTARRQVLVETLDENDVTAVDPTPWQCTPTVCPAVIADKLVYRDGSHLSATYSRWLAPMALAVMAGSAR